MSADGADGSRALLQLGPAGSLITEKARREWESGERGEEGT